MARSSGMSVDWIRTSALAPGYATVIWTCGGAISGNCDTGRVPIDKRPRRTISTETTMARTGRRRICANMSASSLRVVVQLREHLGRLLELHVDVLAVLDLAQALQEDVVGVLEAALDDEGVRELGGDHDRTLLDDAVVADDEDVATI